MEEKIRLTRKEKEFAARNHNLIYTIMRQYHIPVEEYYGEAAYGYLRAVMKYHRQSHLRQYCFSTIVRQSIRCYCGNEMDARKRYAGHIKCSLNEVIDAKGTEYGELYQDSREPFRGIEDQEEMRQLLGKIMPKLTGSQQKQLIYLLEGYRPVEIRRREKKGYSAYRRDMKSIQRVVARSCTGATPCRENREGGADEAF